MQDLLKIAVTFWHGTLQKFNKNEKSILFYLFFPCPPLEKNYAIVILVFPQGFAEVGKNEKKGFRGEATPSREMFFEFFPTEVTWGNTKITRA